MLYWVSYLLLGLGAWAFRAPAPVLLALCALGVAQLARRVRSRRAVHASLAALEAQARAQPGALPTKLRLAEVALALGQSARARGVLEESIAKGYDEAEAYYLLGTARLALGEREGALRALVRAIQLAPRVRHGAGLFACAHVLEALGRDAEARTAYEEGLAVDRTALSEHWRLARLAQRGGDPVGARAALAALLAVWPELPAYARPAALGTYLRARAALWLWRG